jgi:hypothetical protein
MENYFNTLNAINVNDKVEKKNGLTYLSWAWAWGEVKKIHPDASYTIYENADGWNYHTDGRTAWVKTGVTVNGLEHIEYLPVMDARNRSIPLENITSFDVNKAIQRSLTKACARHGLGLYIYAGEDLPEGEEPEKQVATPPGAPKYEAPKEKKTTQFVCNQCGKRLVPYQDSNGKEISIRQHAMGSEKKFGQILCLDCIHEMYPDSIKV